MPEYGRSTYGTGLYGVGLSGGLPTYSSVMAQTIRTVQHLDGVERIYVFVPGIGVRNYGASNYGDANYGGVGTGAGITPATQAEKWELDELSVEYGLVAV